LTSRWLLALVFAAILPPTAARPTEWKPSGAVLVGMEECCPAAAWVEAEQRIRRELEMLGITVIHAQGTTHDAGELDAEAQKLATSCGASLAVRLVRIPWEDGAEIRIVDVVSDDTTHHQLADTDTGEPSSPEIVALKAIEAIYSHHYEYQLPREGSAEPVTDVTVVDLGDPAVEVRPEPETRAADVTSRLRLEVGPAILASPGGVGPRGAMQLGLGWSPVPALCLKLDGYIGLLGQDIQQPDASSTFQLGGLRGWVMIATAKQGVLRPQLGVGGGAVFLQARGTSTLHEVRTDRLSRAYVGGNVELLLVPSHRVWFRLGVELGGLIPEVTVEFADQPMVTFGSPIFCGSAGVVFNLP